MVKNKLFKKYGLFIIIGALIIAAIFIFPQLTKTSETGAHAQKELKGTGISMVFYDANGKVIGTDTAVPSAAT